MLIVGEDDGEAVVSIVLSNPSSADLTVVVLSSSGTACGEHYCIDNSITELSQEEVWIMILDHTMSQFLLERPAVHLILQ